VIRRIQIPPVPATWEEELRPEPIFAVVVRHLVRLGLVRPQTIVGHGFGIKTTGKVPLVRVTGEHPEARREAVECFVGEARPLEVVHQQPSVGVVAVADDGNW
jgi:hypothetical protein